MLHSNIQKCVIAPLLTINYGSKTKKQVKILQITILFVLLGH
jgi:hypothetical protein